MTVTAVFKLGLDAPKPGPWVVVFGWDHKHYAQPPAVEVEAPTSRAAIDDPAQRPT